MPELPAIGKYLDITFNEYTSQLAGLRSILDSQRFDLAVIELNLTDNTHDEYDSGLVVVEALSTFNPEIKQVIFSQFMNPGSERGKQVRGRIDKDFAYTFTHAYQLQGKSGDVQRNIFELTKLIFRMM